MRVQIKTGKNVGPFCFNYVCLRPDDRKTQSIESLEELRINEVCLFLSKYDLA